MTSCSLLISTYNWPDALELCLKSVLLQSTMPGEIIICDDGSTEETAKVVADFIRISPVPVIHVWQEDKSFRLAMIRNKGFVVAKSRYLIQTDGDLIFHHHFIRDHLKFAKPGHFTTGSRVLLSLQTTQALFKNQSLNIKEHSKNNKNFFNSFYVPALHEFFASRYKTKGKHVYYVKGCNMAFWKEDLLKVNGYNEDFTGWGKEDSELAIRLINAGIKKRFLKFGGICYHLFHKEATREMEKKNTEMMIDAQRNKLVRAVNGMDRPN